MSKISEETKKALLEAIQSGDMSKVKLMMQNEEQPKQKKISELYEHSDRVLMKHYAEINKEKIYSNTVLTEKQSKSYYVWNAHQCLYQPCSESKLSGMIADWLDDELTKEIDDIKQEICNEDDAKQIRELSKQLNDLKKLRRNGGKFSIIKEMSQFLHELFYNEDFLTKLDGDKDVINFENGVLNLKTGAFRQRKATDIFSITLPYSYTKAKQAKVEYLEKILKQICNDSKEDYKFLMEWLGYCLTGHNNQKKFLTMVGYSANNGKSVILSLFENVFPIYFLKMEQRVLDESYELKHKSLALLSNLIRLAVLDELRAKTLDIKLVKEWTSGQGIATTALYKNIIKVAKQAKLMIASNKELNFKNDAGMVERVLYLLMTNKFLGNEKYKKAVEKGEKVYKADKSICDKLEEEEYKCAFVDIIINYSKAFYANNKTVDIPESVQKFSMEACDVNDEMEGFIADYCIITNNKEDLINKDEFMTTYYGATKNRQPWVELLSDLKRLGYTYDSEKRSNSKKGCMIGMKFGEHPDDDGEVQPKEQKQQIVEEVKEVQKDSTESETEKKPKKAVKPQPQPIVFLTKDEVKQVKECDTVEKIIVPEKKKNLLLEKARTMISV